MKFFRVIGILLILLVVSLTTKRCSTDRNCPKVKSYESSFSSFEIHQLDGEELISIMNPSGVVAPSGCRKDFGIEFVFEMENTEIANCKPVHSLFIQSAYADCPTPNYNPKERIISIQVFSDKGFDETHPAGTNITEFFKIYETEYKQNQWYVILIPFESYFKSLPAYFDSKPSFIKYLCVLTATTIEAGEYEFTFVVSLSDERTLEKSIKAVLE
jgi:hypothetical protein